jgi:RNA polymerase sigma-70 factor, ECF subfamily
MDGTLELGAAILETPQVTETPSSHAESDAALVKASQQGDTEAFGQLYRRYARMVHGILLGRVRAADAEDLVQDVFLRALPRLRDLRDISRFGGWLASITRNIAADHYRRSQPHAENRDNAADLEERVAATASASKAGEAAEILECIRSLPEAYRETLILRLVEGMTGPEIAARTGLVPGSVRVNLHRGMSQLREKLAQRGISQPTNPSRSKMEDRLT